MNPYSSLKDGVPSHLQEPSYTGFGGDIISNQNQYNNTRKKSKVRLNDQLIPKPTDINMAEKMIMISTPKQHPYSSHISKFAMFPSFRSPDDPETGVRATSKPFLNPLIPNRAPDVTLLSKTIGGPYRHEVLATPMTARKKAALWVGEKGFWDHTKPFKGEKQVFYPTPPKTVLPNPKLRDWDLTLSERTSNMLKNLERSHWLTSYQMQYTGSGPANPLKMDDFREKMCGLTRLHSHSAPLRERSFPVFVASKPIKGCRRIHGNSAGRSTCSPSAADELPDPSPSLNQHTASATINQPRPQETTAEHNEAPDPNQTGQSQSKYSSGSTDALSAEPSQEVMHKQQPKRKSSACEGRERETYRVQFDQSPIQVSVSQSCKDANAAWITDAAQPPHLHNRPLSHSDVEVSREKSLCVKDEPCSREDLKACRGLSHTVGVREPAGIECNSEILKTGQMKMVNGRGPWILPRPPIMPGISHEGRKATHSLLDLQDSFSKTAAHREFNNSVTRAAVNLRDNVVTGRKHDFYGINCYYLHG